MSLPEAVTIKFNLYTLACRELLDRWYDLQVATQDETRVDCVGRFNRALTTFFKEDSGDSEARATEQLMSRLLTEAGSINDFNKNAADVFGDLAPSIHAKLGSWQYEGDLANFHIQGQEIARYFFGDSPCLVTQERLAHECHLDFEFNNNGLRPAPTGYQSRCPDAICTHKCGGTVMVRFSYEHDFTSYLSYPFQFLHEYTAHVYAFDNQCNLRFNDGWMMHAIARFLEPQEPDKISGLMAEQADIFYSKGLFQQFDPNTRAACLFARQFDHWLSGLLPNRFMDITYELAAFQPGPGEPPGWPTKFINALQVSFSSPGQLLSKIQSVGNIRDLMKLLQPNNASRNVYSNKGFPLRHSSRLILN